MDALAEFTCCLDRDTYDAIAARAIAAGFYRRNGVPNVGPYMSHVLRAAIIDGTLPIYTAPKHEREK